jgi:hypothetical protein
MDTGVEAARRAKVGVKLGLMDRARYFGTADTFTLLEVSSSEPNVPITVQADIELWGPE